MFVDKRIEFLDVLEVLKVIHTEVDIGSQEAQKATAASSAPDWEHVKSSDPESNKRPNDNCDVREDHVDAQ